MYFFKRESVSRTPNQYNSNIFRWTQPYKGVSGGVWEFGQLLGAGRETKRLGIVGACITYK